MLALLGAQHCQAPESEREREARQGKFVSLRAADRLKLYAAVAAVASAVASDAVVDG